MVEPFAAAAFSMEPGAISEQPVQTEFGWHVIKVEDKRTVPPPEFNQVEGQVRQIIYGELYGAWMAQLQASASIVDPNAPAPAAPPAEAAIPNIVPTEAVQCLTVAQVAPAPAPAAPAPAAPAPAAPAPAAPAPAAPAPAAPAPAAPAP
jgi:hypothetical protein